MAEGGTADFGDLVLSVPLFGLIGLVVATMAWLTFLYLRVDLHFLPERPGDPGSGNLQNRGSPPHK